MSSFLAGAIPPWADVLGFCLVVLALLLGMWVGMGVGERRGFEEAEEEFRAEARARRTHPVYRQRRTSTAAFLDPPPEVAHEWDGHVGQALTLANEEPFSVTAWTQANGEAMDEFLRKLLWEHPVREAGP
jgi:hypothetical protein